jgi:hypothetical protein
MDAKTLIDINGKLKDERCLWDSLWQDVADYIVFRKASIVGEKTQGEKLTSKMFDSVATVAAGDLASWIHGQLTEMSMQWFSLKIDGLPARHPLEDWLEDCRRRLHRAIQESNFSSQWLELLNDLVSFGTGAIFVEENEIEVPGFNGFNFISMPPGTYSISNDRSGRTNVLFREFKLTAQKAFDMFGDKVSDDIKKDIKRDPNNKHEFLHCCFPTGWFDGKKGKFPYDSYYLDCKAKRILRTGGYWRFPYSVVPWLRESGEDYGRGPGIIALPDVKSLHKAKELGLKEWSLAILPPMLVQDNGVVGTIKLTPAGITVVRDVNNGIKPLMSGAPYNANRMNLEDIRQQIREIFHVDKVRYIPPRDETGEMTAYEVARRYQLAQKLLGPTYGNIVFHGLDSIIETTFNMMLEAGAFSPPPEKVPALRIQYESPLARAQRSQDVQAIQDTFQVIFPMLEMNPGIMDNFNLDQTAVIVAKALGYPVEGLNSEQKRKAIRDAKAKAQAQAQALETMERGAGAAANLAKIPEGTIEKLAGGGG